MHDEWTIDDARDCQRDMLALLRAFNVADGRFDHASRVILDNADTRLLARFLLGITHYRGVQNARLSGCTTDGEIRAFIEERLASLQAEVIANPDLFMRETRPGEPQD